MLFDSQGRNKIATDWSAITGIPGMVDFLADLADPNADRMLVWDDTAQALAFKPASFLGNTWYSNTTIPSGNTVANSTTETAFASSYTIAAGALRAGSVIRIRMFGTYGTDGVLAPTIQGKLKLGSTAVLDTGSVTAVVSATNRGWSAEGQIIVQSIGTSGAIDAQGQMQFSTAATAALAINMSNTATFTVDTTSTLSVSLTVQWGTADTDNTITLRQFVVEISSTG